MCDKTDSRGVDARVLGEDMSWAERVDAARHTPIVDVVKKLDLGEPKKCGRQFSMRCPFHGERSPSFFISPQRNLYNCFGCEAGGDVIKLWMTARRVGFKTAVREMVP